MQPRKNAASSLHHATADYDRSRGSGTDTATPPTAAALHRRDGRIVAVTVPVPAWLGDQKARLVLLLLALVLASSLAGYCVGVRTGERGRLASSREEEEEEWGRRVRFVRRNGRAPVGWNDGGKGRGAGRWTGGQGVTEGEERALAADSASTSDEKRRAQGAGEARAGTPQRQQGGEEAAAAGSGQLPAEQWDGEQASNKASSMLADSDADTSESPPPPPPLGLSVRVPASARLLLMPEEFCVGLGHWRANWVCAAAQARAAKRTLLFSRWMCIPAQHSRTGEREWHPRLLYVDLEPVSR